MEQILITVVQGNFGYDLNFTLTDAAGNILDLTTATLKFNAQLLSDLSVHFSGAMTVTGAVAGQCKYTVQSTDFEVAGTYNCQIQVTFPSTGELITFADIQAVAEPSVPISN